LGAITTGDIKLSGAITAMITPFTEDDKIDVEGLKNNVNFQIENNISGLVPLGTTGESPTITDEERELVIKTVVEAANKRVPVIVGTGTNSTRTTIEHSKKAQELGADAVLVVNPYYNKPTQEGLYRHFKAVSESIEIPVIVYNIQGRTAVNIETSTMARFKEVNNIIAVKEASGNLDQMKEVIQEMPEDFAVLSGDDNMTLDLIKEGGKGVISVLSNLMPKQVSNLCRNALEGNIAEAEKINEQLSPMFKAAFIETNPIPIKTAMGLVGMPSGQLRLPLCELMPENLESLKKTMTEMEILR
jgi:4-hydroxy-tetrahydrodipicolinate synthase